jgi:hypothetical protein
MDGGLRVLAVWIRIGKGWWRRGTLIPSRVPVYLSIHPCIAFLPTNISLSNAHVDSSLSQQNKHRYDIAK